MKSLAVLNECGFTDKQIDYLKQQFPNSVFYTDTNSEDLAIKRTGKRNIIIMDQFKFSFSEKLLKKCPKLQLIVVNTTAFDSIDLGLLKKYQIQLANLQEYATTDVAEVTLSMVLALNNRLNSAQNLVKSHLVDDLYPNHPQFPLIKRKQLLKQTLGIIGMGKIGTSCAKLFLSLGMQVVGFNRSPTQSSPCPMFSLESVCKISDIILITLAYTKGEMDGFINKELLSFVKDDAILVSIAHPNLIDIDYLINNPKKFSGIGFDYLVTKKVRELMSVRSNNIIITPHLGSQSKEAIQKMTQSLISTVINFKSI